MGCKQKIPARLYWLDGRVTEVKDFDPAGIAFRVANADGTCHSFIYSGQIECDGKVKLVEIPSPK